MEVNHWPFCMILKIDQGIIIIVKLITGNTWRQWGLIDLLEISSLGHEEQMTVKAWDVHNMISVHGLRAPLLLSSCTVWFRDRDSQKYKGDYYVPPLHDEPGPGSSPILAQAFWWHMLAILLRNWYEVCNRKVGTPDDYKLGKKSLIF